MTPATEHKRAAYRPLLQVSDLRVNFRGRDYLARAVDGIDFTVGRGEIVCLVGESGCGKTVSALSLLGLVPQPPGEIEGGKVLFDGRNLLECTQKELETIRGRRIAMVFQEPMTSLNPLFTIGHQIGEAITTHSPAVGHAALEERVTQLLTAVEIPAAAQRRNDYPHTLSGGQRQRAMIAMALACEPALIIADEPTTALDVTVQAGILRLLRDLSRSRGTAILLITHNLGVVAEIADRVYVMYAGNIVESAAVEQLFDDPLHPYTMGLLASLPHRTRKGQPLYSIPGSVPDPAFKPSGCPFHPRCAYVEPSCRVQRPKFSNFAAGHRARCPVTHALWLKGALAPPGQRLQPQKPAAQGEFTP